MASASSATEPPVEVRDLLEGPNKESLIRLLSTKMSNVTENESTKAILAWMAEHLTTSAVTKGADYVQALSDVILSLHGLRDIAFGREQYALWIALAKSWTALEAFQQAIEFDLKTFNVPPNMENNVLPTEKLECCVRLLMNAKHVDDNAVQDAVLFRAMPLHRRAFRQLKSEQAALERATPVMLVFLGTVGAAQLRRGFFLEAARTFVERHERSGAFHDYECAVVAALLGETSAQRTRLLESLHLHPDARGLGELSGVLAKAFHAQLLSVKDAAAIVQSYPLTQAALAVPANALSTAINQHNIMAISRVYDNISFASLARLLEGMEVTDVGSAVAQMVSEDRLRAKVDQAAQWITFRTPDSATAAAEWDAKLGTACNAVSYATELITMAHPDYRQYLMEED